MRLTLGVLELLRTLGRTLFYFASRHTQQQCQPRIYSRDSLALAWLLQLSFLRALWLVSALFLSSRLAR